MADQATVKANAPAANRLGAIHPGSGAGPISSDNGNTPCPGDMVTNVAEFGENLLNLAELQARLVALELKQDVQTVKINAPVILGGAVLGIAGLPIVLAGIAELLVSELGMRRGFALLGVAVVVLAIAGASIAFAAIRLRRSVVGFPLTTEEFTRNLNWVRTILRHSGRSTRGRRG
jgi:Putative Actinobacterial Holin-X, holin superfamily III